MAKKQTKLFEKINSNNGKVPKKIDPETQKRINDLVQQIKYHRDAYYNKMPEITDARYDLLEDELRQLDPGNPILLKVGQDSSEIFTKREHQMPMMSQDKASSPEEFLKWAKSRNYHLFIVQFKLDGVSIELQYTSGVFQCAVSRGDGQVGDDLTQNVIKMNNFVPRLSDRFTGAVRAEVLLFRDVFNEKYSDKQNPRNAAAGIARRKDGEGSEDLSLIFYDGYSTTSEVTFGNELEKIKWLKEQGFETVKTKTVKSAEEVIEIREKVNNRIRNELNYEIDGLVVKGREIDLEDLKRAKPNSQIAFKFPAEEIDTILKDLEWSVSGHNYTPVAVLEPVEIAGTRVSRASLANPNLLKELNLKIGSRVIVSKRGDIIPKVEGVLSNPESAQEIEVPSTCEKCGTKLINEGTRLYCPNEACEKRSYHRLIKWINTLGVKHFSEKLMLSKLFESGKVIEISDLYELNPSDLTKFEGVQEKSAKKALDNLNEIEAIPMERFIAGFDIEGMGEKQVKKIVDAGYDSLEKMESASINELSKINGFGNISAKVLLDGIKEQYPQMKRVLNSGKIRIQEPITEGKLKGLTFCFTGKLETMTRKEAQELVAQHGGEAKSDVTKGLSYLVTNSTENTSKYAKARKQGTPIVTEEEFLSLLG